MAFFNKAEVFFLPTWFSALFLVATGFLSGQVFDAYPVGVHKDSGSIESSQNSENSNKGDQNSDQGQGSEKDDQKNNFVDLDAILADMLATYDSDGFVARRVKRTLQEIEKDYHVSQQKRFCVNTFRLRQSSSLSDSVIYFEGRSGASFLNFLSGRCPRLALEDRFSYEIVGSSNLCRGTIITILDPFGRAMGSCVLGDFYLLERRTS